MNPNIEENKIKEKLSEIILRAWQEPSFKQKLIETPPDIVCNEYGIRVEGNATVIFHLDSSSLKHFTIPMNPSDYIEGQVTEDIKGIARKHVDVTCTVSWTGGSHRVDIK